MRRSVPTACLLLAAFGCGPETPRALPTPADAIPEGPDLRGGGGGGGVYGAEYVDQTFPLAAQPFELAPREVASGYLEMRNTGSEPWRPGETYLGTTEPRDGASPLTAAGWISPQRAATIDRVVMPGGTGRFAFDVQAPRTPGEYPQFFNLVQEGVAWFGDPGQGGPPDDQIQIRVTVLDVPEMSDAGPMETPDGGVMTREPMDEGCACRATGARSGRSTPWLLLAGASLLGLRRLRRSRTSPRRSGRR